ncbi:MAG: nickel pincer cofactor biosynthesis protein LarB [Thermoplasmata archaeon]
MARAQRRRRTPSGAELAVGDFARYDLGRAGRTGAPEVVLAEGKDADHLVAILRALATKGHAALISRLGPKMRRRLAREARAGLPVTLLAGGRVARLDGRAGPAVSGVVALVSAGTADAAIASEASAVLEFGGATVVRAFDVGVAGIHRLARALARLERAHPSVYLVFAGREGALPTVVAGLVRAPVVGVPTSVGYGRGGRGEAALGSMLQSCAPIAVVNIDAGVPAALFALQVLAGGASAGPRRRHP